MKILKSKFQVRGICENYQFFHYLQIKDVSSKILGAFLYEKLQSFYYLQLKFKIRIFHTKFNQNHIIEDFNTLGVVVVVV